MHVKMTLKEIAAKAGVSVATVSYVLNDSAKVSDETKQRVEQIIKETGYRSNILAKSLRKNRTNIIGIIVEDVTVWHTPYIIDGINELAEEKGYQTILSNLRLLSKIDDNFQDISKYQKDIDWAVDILLGMQVDGIIYVGMHDRPIPHIIKDVHKEVVYCYCYTFGEGSSVRYSNQRTSYELTKLFLEKGHKKFGVVKGLETSEPAALRFRGIKKALDEAGIQLEEKNIVTGDWKYKTAKEQVVGMLTQKECPDAIIAMNDEMAMGVMKAAEELNIEVPRELSVCGFDNADIVHYTNPKLTTVERPLQEMGYRSMDILLNKIENDAGEDISITLPCEIIQGDTICDMNT